jgi:hypothetical protein
MSRCEVCEGPPEKTCGYDDQPMLNFCTEHYVEHLEGAHPANRHARAEAVRLRARLKKSEQGLLRQLERIGRA